MRPEATLNLFAAGSQSSQSSFAPEDLPWGVGLCVATGRSVRIESFSELIHPSEGLEVGTVSKTSFQPPLVWPW